MCLDPINEAQMKSLDLAFDSVFGKKKPAKSTSDRELIEATERHQRYALADRKAWAEALSDFGCDQGCRAREGKLTHACLDALIAGDEAQFGHLLARSLRAAVLSAATSNAQGELSEARATGAAA